MLRAETDDFVIRRSLNRIPHPYPFLNDISWSGIYSSFITLVGDWLVLKKCY